MHELSIAQAILTLAERHARGRRVVKVEVRVGHLRQVVPDSLDFAFGLLTPGTTLEGCELEIAHVPARGRCRRCGAQSALEDFPLRCARCGELDVEVIAGEELLVDALEVEQESIKSEIEQESMTSGLGQKSMTSELEQESMTSERVGHGSHV